MEVGDRNTKLFHRHASFRCAQNTIWNLSNAYGRNLSSFSELTKEAMSHFSRLFQDPKDTNISDIKQEVALFFTFYNSADNDLIGSLVTLEGIKSTLLGFKKSKSHGLVGWTVEFYEEFFFIFLAQIY